MGMRNAVVVGVALMIVGCATPAQQKATAIVQNDQAAVAQLRACTSAVYNSPAYDALRPHLPADMTMPGIEQMTDSHFASDIESQAILATHPQVQLCREAYLKQISITTPTLVPIIAAAFTQNEDDLIAVVQKKKAWGEYVKGIRDRAPGVQAQITAELQRIGAGLQQENQAELAARERAANAFAQYMQTQQMINAMNRPVFTNCTGFGNSVNCISH